MGSGNYLVFPDVEILLCVTAAYIVQYNIADAL